MERSHARGARAGGEKDELKRDFYAELCRIEKWSTRTLEKKIGGTLYERAALSKKPEKLKGLLIFELECVAF